MRFQAVLIVVLVFMAGCIGGADDGDPAPTTSVTPPPKPLQVFERNINACPQNANPPVQTVGVTGRFEVKPGYDEIAVAFHSSGEGQGGGDIRWDEEGNKVIWSRATGERISTAPVLCGGHSHTGSPVTVPVEPGNYTVRISYAGAVAIHLIVTARSSKADMAANHTHTALPDV